MKNCNCKHHCCEYEELELTPEERYVKRLGYRKNELRSIQNNLRSARREIWDKGGFKASGCNIEANLCMALEGIEAYIRQQLNWELKEKGFQPITRK